MNKKLFFLILMLIVLLGFVLVFGGIIFVRFYTIESLYRKAYDNVKKDNYYLKTTIKENENISTTEAYYRDDVGKLVAENKVYTWTDGEYAYMIDEEQKVAYVLNINSENVGLVSYDMFASIIPGYNRNHFGRFKIAINMKNEISKTYIDDKKCYIISVVDNGLRRSVWVDEDGKPIKAEVVLDNGSKIEYDYEISFHQTKLKDIELPKINDYKVIDTESNEIVQDKNDSISNTNTNTNTTSDTNVNTNTN